MQPVAIACGDASGIGPEVTLKAVAAELPQHPDARFVLVGEIAELRRWNQRLGLGLTLEVSLGAAGSPGPIPFRPARVVALEPPPAQGPHAMPRDASPTAWAAVRALEFAARGCLRGEYSALVTAPVSKEAILRCGIPFVGQTEFLAQLAQVPEVTMMLVGTDTEGRALRVALVTTHLPLRRVADAITRPGVLRAIRHAARACRQLGLATARVGVCGLNPHAGEGGTLGTEEIEILAPTIAQAQGEGLEVSGPRSGDTIFHEALHGRFDAVVAMYHDQGLAPLKTVAFDTGVNWTLGLPFPRTSPDHGTAFDLAGKGVARADSMRSAIRLALQLASPGAKAVGSDLDN